MEKFNLIGVSIFNKDKLNHTRYFEIGEMKEAVEYANSQEKNGFDYDFSCCDKYGNYICKL